MALLRETERPVTEICLDVGFASLGSFSRTFTRVIGMSPTAYRLAWRTGAGTAGYLPTCVVMSWTRPSDARQNRSFEKRELTALVALRACSQHSRTPSSTCSTTTRPSTSTSASSGSSSADGRGPRPVPLADRARPGHPESQIVLSTPDMGHDEETAAAIRELVAKGGGNG